MPMRTMTVAHAATSQASVTLWLGHRRPTAPDRPPAATAIGPRDIHLWIADLDQPYAILEQLRHTLSADELGRAARLRLDRDRRHYITGRGVLRLLIGGYLGRAPDRVRFRYSQRGKPALADPLDASRLDFNLAHSHGIAVYAFTAGTPVGVDVERIRPMPDALAIAGRFFSPREQSELRAVPVSHVDEAFFNGWTRKEAYLKALGDGLAQPLDRFDVSLTPGEPARLLSIDGDARRAADWALVSLAPTAGTVAAMAITNQDWNLTFHRWGGESDGSASDVPARLVS